MSEIMIIFIFHLNKTFKYDFNHQNHDILLDKKHSHFILVSNPSFGEKFGGEIKFRNELEKKLNSN